jgi:hypothetical protein
MTTFLIWRRGYCYVCGYRWRLRWTRTACRHPGVPQPSWAKDDPHIGLSMRTLGGKSRWPWT